MVIIIICISFFLDGLLSIYQSISFLDIIYFKPLFTIVSLSFIYLWCFKNHKIYYKTCFLIGIIYDLLYTNTFPLNILLFLLLGLIIQKLYLYFETTFLNGVIINLIIITIYHIISFIVLFLIGYLPFDFYVISHNLLSIIITNSIFYIILYIVFRREKHNKHYSL
jgi:rod shape-determining protein MreD